MAKNDTQDTEQDQSENAPPVQDKNAIQDVDVIEPKEEKKNDDSKSPETNVENKVSENLPVTVKKTKTKAAKAEVVVVLTPEEEQTVKTAYDEIKRIFTDEFKQATQNAMLSTGKYLIKTFYNNDYIEAAKREFTKHRSLSKLFLILKQEKEGNTPQKTWLYNSIGLAIAEKPYEDLANDLKNGKNISDMNHKLLSSWTGNLTVSHKITLIQYAKDLKGDQLQDLIIEIGEKPCKVLELRNRIAKLKGKTPKTPATPVEKLKSSVANKFTQDKISKFNKEELKDLRKELNKILQTIKTEIDKDITATPPATATTTEATA